MIKKISEFTSASDIQPEALIPIVQSANNFSFTYEQLLNDLMQKLINSGYVVVNSLESDSTTNALSAAMGKKLNVEKVDKVVGKDLSTNDFTNDLQSKLNSVEEGAQINPKFRTINNQRIDDGPGNLTITGNVDIADDLTTWDNTKALSAKQGVLLARPATSTNIGRVKPDGITTFINSDGSISTAAVELPTYNSWIFKESPTIPETPNISLNSTLADPDPRNWDVTNTPQFAGWVDAPKYEDGQMWWMSIGTVNGSTRRVSRWSSCIPVIGEEGQSGGFEDFKFGVGTADNYPTPFNTNPNNSNAPNYHPEIWKDFISDSGLTEEQFIWMTHSYYDNSQHGTWSLPVRINGENGADGKGYEYIYLTTVDYVTPERPIAPNPDTTKDQNIPAPWTNNPSGVSEATPYEWVSQRKKIDGNWTEYSLPALWASRGQKGEPGSSWVTEFLGDYNSTREYLTRSNIRQIVKYNDKFYITKLGSDTTGVTIPIGTLPTDVNYWEYFTDQFEMIATAFLFAEGANIAGWIFQIDPITGDKLLVSQDQTDGKPNTVLNGTTGEILLNMQNNWQMGLNAQDNAFWIKDHNGSSTVNIGQYNTFGTDPYSVMTLRNTVNFDELTQLTSSKVMVSNSYYSSIAGGGGGTSILSCGDNDSENYSYLRISNSNTSVPSNPSDFTTVFKVTTKKQLEIIAKNLPTSDPHVVDQLYRSGNQILISNG